MTVQIAYARRPLSRKQSFAGLTPLGPDQFEGYASLFEVPDGAGDVMAPGAFAASLRRRGAAEVRLLYHTPRLGLPDLPDTPELYADTVADAFWRLDALTDLYLKGQFVNTPPSSPADGDAYLIGGAPTGAWSGCAYKIAACRDGGWQFLTPFDGLRGWVEGSGCFIVYQDGVWTDWNALISAAEGSIAAAATCDIGAAGALFLQVTGATTITAFGTVPNRLRFLRFAGALTLTHNATSLVLPGGANIVTAAGDTAMFASDGGGHWRCRQYQRSSGQPTAMALSVTSFSAGNDSAIGTSADSAAGYTNLSIGNSTNGGVLNLKNAGTVIGQIYNTASILNVGTAAAVPVGLLVGGTEAFRLNTDFSLAPSGDNSQNLGSASKRMAVIYAGTGTINTSDERDKQWRGAMSDAEFTAGKEIFAELGGFKFLDAIAAKGEDEARLHYGARAQRVKAILEAHGLGAMSYGFLCHDSWEAAAAEPAQHADIIVEEKIVGRRLLRAGIPARPAGDRYGLRADELACFLLAVLDRRLTALEAR